MKKILSIALAIMLILSVMPTGLFGITASAATTSGTTGQCKWSLDGTVLTISGNGAMGNHSSTSQPWGTGITEVVIENGVTNIGDYAFAGCESLTDVTIGNSVTSIGDFVFNGCTSLASITIPETVTNIGPAFDGCTNLTTVNFNAINCTTPSTSIIIVFVGCTSLTTVNIGENVTKIPRLFLNSTSITSIIIPNSVTSIDGSAFGLCTSLTDVYYSGTEEQWSNITIASGNSYLINATKHYNYCENSVTKGHVYDDDCDVDCNICGYIREVEGVCGKTGQCTWSLDGTVLTISGNGGMAATYFDETLPWGREVTQVVIENGVTSIGDYAFRLCESLTDVTVGDSVTNIGNYAFWGCYRLTDVAIGNSVTTIGIHAFSGCFSLTNVTIPNSVTSIGEGAFYECKDLTSITVDENNNFYSSEDGVLFNKTKTEIICYPCGNTATSYIIPDSVIKICDEAFEWCDRLESITIGHNVTSIGEFAFSSCYLLTSITIPDSVTSIGDSAFFNCSTLKDIWYHGSYDDRNAISIGDNNSYLTNATWHYNTCKTEHTYSIDCDVKCNNCDWERTTTTDHSYTNSCDTDCNYCEQTRTITHSYKTSWSTDTTEHWYECSVCGNKKSVGTHTYYNDCDKTCNGCGYIRTVPDHVYTNDCDTTCNVCGAVRSITHQYKWIIEWEENCGVNGQKYEECSVCHIVRNTGTVIPATGNHTYDNDCDKDCNVCKQIRVTGDHDYIWVVDKEENCGVSGEKHAECSICGSKQFVGTEIPATGKHTYDNDCDTECNVCKQTRSFNGHRYTLNSSHTCDSCKYSKKPNPPTILTVTNNSITLVGMEGFEYSIDGTVWQTSNVFTGLSPNAEYTFYQRVAESEISYVSEKSEGATATTLKNTISKPAMPTVEAKTNNSVTLVEVEGYEYSIDGINWQTSNVFDNLSEPNYTFYQRVAETEISYASETGDGLYFQLYVPGDIDGVKDVTDADAVYLLMHTFFAEDYPVNQNCDFDGDGFVNDADAVYLLMYTFFPEDYPLY